MGEKKRQVLVPEVYGDTPNIQCYNCNKWGHIYNICTEPYHHVIDSNSATGVHGRHWGIHIMQTRLNFTQYGQKSDIKDTWIIFNTAITDSVTNNE